MIIISLGDIFISKGGYVSCTSGGYEWLYVSVAGEAFVMSLTLTIMMQTVMVEKVLYRVRSKNGFFKTGLSTKKMSISNEDEFQEPKVESKIN